MLVSYLCPLFLQRIQHFRQKDIYEIKCPPCIWYNVKIKVMSTLLVSQLFQDIRTLYEPVRFSRYGRPAISNVLMRLLFLYESKQPVVLCTTP